jgi:hypothetical protein
MGSLQFGAQDLHSVCLAARNLIEHCIRLNSLAREHGESPSKRSGEIKRYSQYSEACKQLGSMDINDILLFELERKLDDKLTRRLWSDRIRKAVNDCSLRE